MGVQALIAFNCFAFLLAAAEPETSTGAASDPPLETVVTESRASATSPREDVAASSTVVTRSRQSHGGETLSELLAEVPGTALTRFGGLGAGSFVSIRGSSWEQVRIYLDGVPMNLAAGGEVDLSTFPIGSIERVEVYRGMSPIGFGESGLGGVVSLTSRAPRGNGALAEAGAGAFGTRWAEGGVSLSTGPIGLFGSAGLLRSDGDFLYPSDNGTAFDTTDDAKLRRQNNATHQANAHLRGVARLGRWRVLSVSTSLFEREQGLPGFGIYRTERSRLETSRAVASLSYEGRKDLGAGGRVRATAYALLVRQRFDDPLAEVAISPTDSRTRSNAYGVSLRATKTLSSFLRLDGVLDGRTETNRAHDERVPSDAAPRTHADRIFANAGMEAPVWISPLRLTVIPSARLELSWDQAQTERLQTLRRVLPLYRLGATQEATKRVVLRANVGRYARIPSFAELYANTGRVVGNPDLVPETALNADVGVTYRSDALGLRSQMEEDGRGTRLTLDAAVFGARVENLIQYQQDAYGRAHPRNIGRAQILGVEASAEGRLGDWARLLLQATLSDAKDASDNTASRDRQLPLRPRLRGYARPELKDLPLTRQLQAGLFAELSVTGGNFLDAANLVEVPPRTLLGVTGWVEWRPLKLRLLASGQNLGNSTISDLAGYPLPGRSLHLTLLGRWGVFDEAEP